MAGQCYLCGETGVERGPMEGYAHLSWVKCRHCRCYRITDSAERLARSRRDTSPSILNVFSQTFRLTRTDEYVLLWKTATETVPDPLVVRHIRNIEEALDEPVLHTDKIDEILLAIADKLTDESPFVGVDLSFGDIRALKIAHTSELDTWLKLLEARHQIGPTNLANLVGREGYVRINLLPDGWTRVEQLRGPMNSRTVLVAMSFSGRDRPERETAIVGACADQGWRGLTVDKDQYRGGVMDRIITLINQSRFVVADFTWNKRGVYYEAGYAEGRHIPVIYTAKKGHERRLHFDTRHINHLVWDNHEQLRLKLSDRIASLIPGSKGATRT